MISIERKTVLHLIKLYSEAIEDCKDLTLYKVRKYLDEKDMEHGICYWLNRQRINVYFISRDKIISLCRKNYIMWAVPPDMCHSKHRIITSLKIRLRKLKKMLNEQLYR